MNYLCTATLVLMTFIANLLAKETEVDTPKPNIVFIYADDMGYGDVQILNSERGKIPTPHIDSLAKEGMIFTDVHTSSSVCTPSRYIRAIARL